MKLRSRLALLLVGLVAVGRPAMSQYNSALDETPAVSC
jgi:hypothetical protein